MVFAFWAVLDQGVSTDILLTLYPGCLETISKNRLEPEMRGYVLLYEVTALPFFSQKASQLSVAKAERRARNLKQVTFSPLSSSLMSFYYLLGTKSNDSDSGGFL